MASLLLSFVTVVEENPVSLGHLEGNGSHTQGGSTEFAMFSN
jgi:hypothetical protein